MTYDKALVLIILLNAGLFAILIGSSLRKYRIGKVILYSGGIMLGLTVLLALNTLWIHHT